MLQYVYAKVMVKENCLKNCLNTVRNTAAYPVDAVPYSVSYQYGTIRKAV